MHYYIYLPIYDTSQCYVDINISDQLIGMADMMNISISRISKAFLYSYVLIFPLIEL